MELEPLFAVVPFIVLGVDLAICHLVGRYWLVKRGRSYWAGFVLAVVITPLGSWVIGLLLQADEGSLAHQAVATGSMRKCPFCAEFVKVEATLCRFCQKDLPPIAPTPRPPPSSPATPPGPLRQFCSFCDTEVTLDARNCQKCGCGAFTDAPVS